MARNPLRRRLCRFAAAFFVCGAAGSAASSDDVVPLVPAAYADAAVYRRLDSWSEWVGAGAQRRRIYRHKLLHLPSGRGQIVTCDERNAVLSPRDAARLRRRAFAGRIHPRLIERFAARDPFAPSAAEEPQQTVIAWLAMSRDAVRAVEQVRQEPTRAERGAARNPAARLVALRRQEERNREDRRRIAEVYGAAIEGFLAREGIAESQVVYRYRFAPAVALRLTLAECRGLERSGSVNYLFPEEQAEKEMDVVAPAVRGWTEWANGYTGAGVTIAHIEAEPGKMATANPYLCATAYRPAGASDSHATHIGGILASVHETYKGVAYGCTLLSANAASVGETDLGAATDWAVSQGATILNMSMKLKDSFDGALHWSDVYYDYLVHYTRVFFTKSAGNEGLGSGVVTSPGRGFNSMAVGNIEGQRTSDWADDNMRASSSYGDPITGTEKPEIAAYGSDIRSLLTSSPWVYNEGSGTSYAAPLVAGIAGLCVDADPSLAGEPQALKAKILVSGLAHNIEGDARLSDVDGAGAALATAVEVACYSVTIAEADFDAAQNFEIPVDIPLTAGDPKRIVLAYTHAPSSEGALPDAESYDRCDLDLYLYVGGNVVGQSYYSARNPFEIIDYTPPAAGTGRVKVRNWSWDENVADLRISVAYASKSALGAGPDLPFADVTGRVRTPSDEALADVVLTTGKEELETETGPDGTYTLTVERGWSGTVTPVRTGYEFSPASNVYTDVTLDLAGQNYVGYQPGWDTDGDGMTDGDEIVAGTSPSDSNEYFRISGVASVAGPGVAVYWDSVTGRTYTVYRNADLAADWSNIHETAGSGLTKSYTNPAAPGPRFYRLGVRRSQ